MFFQYFRIEMKLLLHGLIWLGISLGCGFSKAQVKELKHPVFNNWQYKKLESSISLVHSETVLKKIQHFSGLTSWKFLNQISDQLGQTHLRYQQLYKGIPVELGISILHTQNQQIFSFNGDYVPEYYFVGKISISEKEALEKAKLALPSNLYSWNDSGFQQMFKNAMDKQDTSYQPVGQLVYCPQNFDIKQDHFLCYKFKIYSSEPLEAKTIYISAENGLLVAQEDLILHTDVKGTAVTKFSGNKTLTTDSVSPGVYRLRNKAYGNGIETYNMKKGTNYGAAVDFTDADNYWNNVNVNKDEVATDAHWGAEQTYQYFKNTFNRNSYDNAGAKINSYVHYSSNYDNAFWNGVCMTYGDGNTFKPLTALDVCGHEIAHAVTSNSASLVYSYESGALNESFSDIFGNTVEAFGRPTQWDWKIGEDITTTGTGLRSMSNPNLKNNPKFYKGVMWYSGAGDNGGVHYNSGVQNYWYYLIADGVTGTNEKGWSFKIDSLGLDKAGAIAYRNLTVYLTKSSQYADARTFSIMSAADLFGQCSKEVITVTNAWWVCGVGAKYDSGYVKANFTGDTLACFTGTSLNFRNLSDNFRTCQWYFGDGDTSTKINPVHAYNSYGTFNVKLKAMSCFNNKYDSLTRTTFVRVDSNFDICKAAIMPKSGTDSANRCWGYVYDNGGEGNYTALVQSNLKLTIPNADSIRYRFLYLDYENGYDSVVLFHTSVNWATKIGRFTGAATPFAGAWKTVKSNTLWFKHYSDPLVEGKGFKVEFIAYRPTLTVDLPSDSTLCNGQNITLTPTVNGGYAPQHLYTWEDGSHTQNKILNPVVNGKYKVTVKDVCTLNSAEDSINISVRPPLKITANKDTILCDGRSFTATAKATGGKSSTYNYKWTPNKGNVASFLATPLATSNYKVVLSDGCTVNSDSAEFNVYVKPKLQVKLNASQSIQCIGKSVTLTASGQGGDTLGYVFNWNNGLGTGSNKSISLSDTTKVKVTLSDGCTVVNVSDSLTLNTYPAITATKNSDTTVCVGSLVTLSANGKGGNGSALKYNWNSGQNTASINLNGANNQYYAFTISDNCSPSFKDSIKVTLFSPLALTKPLDTTLCDGQTYTVSVIPSGGKVSQQTVTWMPGNLNGNNQVLNPSTVGNNQYKIVLSDACTLKNDTQTLVIKRLAPLTLNFNITPSNVCVGDSAQLSLTIAGGKTASRNWLINNVPSSITKFKVAPSITTNYAIKLQDGCSPIILDNKFLTVNDQPNITLSTNQSEFCIGQPTTFQYSTTNVATVKWFFGNGDSMNGSASGDNFIYPKSGTYSYKARAITSAGCFAMVSGANTVQVYDYPKALISATPTVTNIDFPDVDFTDASTGATSNAWSFGDGSFASNSPTIKHTYTDTGWFKAGLIVSVGPGCNDTATQLIRIKDVYKLFVPNTFTPDVNSVNDVYLPRGRGIKTMQVRIYNRWGQKVFESKDLNKGWDGNLKDGTPATMGVYSIEIVILDTENFRHVSKDVLHLVR